MTKDVCSFCGKYHQKICWKCCEATSGELRKEIEALKKHVKRIETSLNSLVNLTVKEYK